MPAVAPVDRDDVLDSELVELVPEGERDDEVAISAVLEELAVS